MDNITEKLTFATSLFNQNRFTEAKEVYEILLLLYRNNPILYLGYANTLYELQLYDESLSSYKKCIILDSTLHDSFFGIGNCYRKKMLYSEAIQWYLKKLTIEPNNFETTHNIAICYEQLDKLKKAKHFYELSCTLNPTNLTILSSLGIFYRNTNHLRLAKEIFSEIILLKPDNIQAYVELSVIEIMNNEYQTGWSHYEKRLLLDEYQKLFSRFNNSTKWCGENLNNKTLILASEQGFGDNIQFIRFANTIKHLFPKSTIIYYGRKELIQLFATITSIDECVKFGDLIPTHDYFTPLLSIPNILKLQYKNISKTQYIFIDTANEKQKSNIGIYWRGSSFGKEYEQRTLLLENFCHIFSIKKFHFYSFQIAPSDNEKNILDKYKITDLSHQINSFYDTAKLLQNMTFVITSDTAIAHLCGAMNIKCYVLLPKFPGYLWRHKTKKSKWYSTLKLFRYDTSWTKTIDMLSKKILEEY